MKTKLILLFILTCFISLRSNAQEVHFTATVLHEDCNFTNIGGIDIVINSNHPPYTITWSNGATSLKQLGLSAGDYTVTISDTLGNSTTKTITVEACHPSPALTFSPNGDGIADTWGIGNGQFFTDMLLIVYNNIGQKVYEHKGKYDASNAWDGRDYAGVPLPDAAYFYVILDTKYDKSKEKVIKGTVCILR